MFEGRQSLRPAVLFEVSVKKLKNTEESFSSLKFEV
jgi:hypothetical protein